MNNATTKPLHYRLLVASYILGSVATLLGTLAAIGATWERNDLQYPPLDGVDVPPSRFASDSMDRHFGFRP